MPENAQIILTPGSLPEGACYTSEQERYNAFTEATTGALPGTYGTINKGSTAPNADDRANPWVRNNPDGSPDGVYIYFDGSWKRKHPLEPGLIMMWAGAIGDIDAIDGGAAGTATLIAGPFWEVVTAMAAKFPVGVGAFASGATVAVTGTGGEEKHVLVTAELPEVLGTIKSPYTAIIMEEPGEGAFSLGSDNANISKVSINDAIKGGDAVGHNTLPPYYGLYFVKRSIRQYYSI